MAKKLSWRFMLAIMMMASSVVVGSVAPVAAAAAQAAPSASEQDNSGHIAPGLVIEAATTAVMAVVLEAPAYVDDDPERFYAAIGAELDAFVDFRGFAKGVMGEYASKSRYSSLDKAGRNALRRQLKDFAVVIRKNLIETYAKGLLAFGGSRVELKGTEVSPGSTRVASVTQLVYGDQSRVYTLRYQMGQYADGRWMLRNIIIENINLGEIYQGQFEAAAKAANGDLDTVIADWNLVAQTDSQES